MHVDFLGPTYAGRSSALDPSRAINFLPEINPNPVGKSIISLVGSPGTGLLFDVGNGGPVRALYVFNNTLYTVSGGGLFSWRGNSLTLIAELATTTSPVVIADNGVASQGAGGNQIMIVDGVNGYIYNPVSSTFSLAPCPVSPNYVTYLNGYFIITSANSMTVHTSKLYDGTVWPGLAVANALSSSTPCTAVVAYDTQLFVFKSSDAEVWYDNGTTTDIGSPFSVLQGTPVNFGVIAPLSISQNGDYLYALASDGTDIRAVQFAGYSATALFPPSIAYRVAQFPTVTDAIGYGYSDSGHDFYVLTFPTGNATFVYDATTQMWHERSTYDPGVPRRSPNRHCSNCYAFWQGKNIVGDYRNGMVYVMSNQYVTDNGSPIVSSRIAPITFDREDFSDLFFYDLFIDAEVGKGGNFIDPSGGNTLLDPEEDVLLDPSGKTLTDNSGVLAPPQATLSVSVDGGNKWSQEYPISMGGEGQYMTRLRWRKVGYGFNCVFDLTISDPISKVLVDSYADVSF